MARLIDADALIKDCKRTVQIADELKELNIKKTFSAMLNLVLTQPTIDAVPVRHGKWSDCYEFNGCCDDEPNLVSYSCSVCKGAFRLSDFPTIEHFRYCPNCGARMDKE